MLENQVRSVFLGIGSNLGNRIHNIQKAKILLETENIVKIKKTSSYYKSLSWPNPKKPYFINIVVECSTKISPLNLLKQIKKIEILLGRTKAPKNSPRTCDIDILDFQQKSIKIKDEKYNINIPHPRLHLRNFVLLPLFEIKKNWIHPVKNKKISVLLNNLGPTSLRAVKIL